MKRNSYLLIIITVISLIAIGIQLTYSNTSTEIRQLQEQARNAHVDFDVSMKTSAYTSFLNSKRIYGQELDFFKSLYDRYNLKQVSVQNECRIPKIIHHIWLGSALSQKDQEFYQSWRTHNNNWTFVFWTDSPTNYNKGNIVTYSFEELKNILNNTHEPLRIVMDIRDLKFENRVYIDQSNNYGEQSDILRYEIVYRFGGVYVDCDFECYKGLTLFHHMYDFYTALQPLDTNRVQLGCALFGAIPNHPIMRSCVENIKHNRHIPQIVAKTGPIFFTHEFYKIAGRTGLKDIAFPSSYFYPRGYEERYKPKNLWCKTESFATHHWAGSWLEPSGFINASTQPSLKHTIRRS